MKKMGSGRRRAGLVAALVLLAAGAVAAVVQAVVVTVTAQEAKIRSRKTLLGSVIPGGEVQAGARLTLNAREEPWANVTYGAVTGWIHSSAITEKKGVVLSGSAESVRYTGQDISAGKKGFSDEVEKAYKDANPNLVPFFGEVDRVQRRRIAEEALEEFAAQGRLGGGGR